MAKGILMKKISLHKPIPASRPPSTGPIIVVSALKVDQEPKAFPLRSGGIMAEIMARLPGAINAPPSPCTALAVISICLPGAIPQKKEDTLNKTIPMIKIFFLP